jgi:hypothetical protein
VLGIETCHMPGRCRSPTPPISPSSNRNRGGQPSGGKHRNRDLTRIHKPAAEVVEAFRDWRPAPEPAPVARDDDEKLPDPVELALNLLRGIADEPFISGRFRARARGISAIWNGPGPQRPNSWAPRNSQLPE